MAGPPQLPQSDTPHDLLRPLRDNLNHVIRGKPETVEFLLTALCAGGHVLIEDVPGVGKTTLCKALARSLDADFRRIQFTPDLLPTDILGGMVYSPRDGSFTFRPGPVFCHVLLADEINRASPRTQSALLECMSEGQVTIEGTTHRLAEPFMVVATQNPVEYHGTYPLPEAQLDRFVMQLEMGYPDEEQEVALVLQQRITHPLESLAPVGGVCDVLETRRRVVQVRMDESLLRYAAALVRTTRSDPRLRLGASPRATAALYRSAQSLAFARGRDYVLPDDIKQLAVPVLAHRLVMEPKTAFAGITKASIVEEIAAQLPVPA